MPDLTALLASLKSPKVALAAFLFSAALLFAPFDWLSLTPTPLLCTETQKAGRRNLPVPEPSRVVRAVGDDGARHKDN